MANENVAAISVRSQALWEARRIAPLLALNALNTERERRVVDENVASLREAGLFQMLQSRRYGGLSLDMLTFTQVLSELAGACASTAWITSVACHSAWIVAKFPQPIQDMVWCNNPKAMVCGVFQALGKGEPVEGGVEVSGKWPFCSGSAHADWFLMGLRKPGTSGPEGEFLALLPRSDVEIADTWHVSGLKGTGSNTVVVSDIFVPQEHVISLALVMDDGNVGRHPDEPLFDVVAPLLFNTLAAGPMAGLARAMLGQVVAKISSRAIYTTVYADASEAPTVHTQLGEAASMVDAAEMFAERLSSDADRFAREGTSPGPLDRARARMDNAMVAQCVARAMELLINVNGASSFADSNPIQRMQRDFDIMRRHASVAIELSKEHYGRRLLGKSGVVLIA